MPASPESPALSETDVDDMIGIIRAGTWASLTLLSVSAVALVWGSLHAGAAPVLRDQILIIGEMLLYATCAALIWHFSRVAIVALYAFCVLKLIFYIIGIAWVGMVVGILLIFVIHRSCVHTFKLHRLLRQARA